VFTRDLGWSVFQCVAVPLVAQKSEMAVSPDRVADGHKSFITERFDCVPCLLFNPRRFLAKAQVLPHSQNALHFAMGSLNLAEFRATQCPDTR